VLTETNRSSKEEKEFRGDRCNGMKIVEDEWDSNDRRLGRMYQAHHPQVTTAFEEAILGKRLECSTEIGRLRMVMMHRPGEEIKNITPPYEKWRWLEAPILDEMIQDHERLVRAYEDEGVEVVIRKPETNRPARLVKSIYTEDPSFPDS